MQRASVASGKQTRQTHKSVLQRNTKMCILSSAFFCNSLALSFRFSFSSFRRIAGVRCSGLKFLVLLSIQLIQADDLLEIRIVNISDSFRCKRRRTFVIAPRSEQRVVISIHFRPKVMTFSGKISRLRWARKRISFSAEQFSSIRKTDEQLGVSPKRAATEASNREAMDERDFMPA